MMVRIVRGLCLMGAAFALLFLCGPPTAPAVPKREIVLPKKGPPPVDVMIVLDITGSMDWAIKSIDQEVQLLVDHVKNGKLDVQFGITVFRDELMRSPDDARAGITDDPFTFHFKGRPYTTDGAEIKRVLSLRGAPVVFDEIWLPAAPFKGLTAEKLSGYRGPMYGLFESEFGVRMIRAEEKIRAVAAEGQAAELLAVSPGTPLLSVERLSLTYGDKPVELRRGLYNTSAHHYRNELS